MALLSTPETGPPCGSTNCWWNRQGVLILARFSVPVLGPHISRLRGACHCLLRMDDHATLAHIETKLLHVYHVLHSSIPASKFARAPRADGSGVYRMAQPKGSRPAGSSSLASHCGLPPDTCNEQCPPHMRIFHVCAATHVSPACELCGCDHRWCCRVPAC